MSLFEGDPDVIEQAAIARWLTSTRTFREAKVPMNRGNGEEFTPKVVFPHFLHNSVVSTVRISLIKLDMFNCNTFALGIAWRPTNR